MNIEKIYQNIASTKNSNEFKLVVEANRKGSGEVRKRFWGGIPEIVFFKEGAIRHFEGVLGFFWGGEGLAVFLFHKGEM